MGGVPPQAAGHDGNGPDPVRGPGERVPVAFWFGWPGLAQLLVVSIVVAAANIAFNAAGGAYLKALVPPQDLLVANGRFESATWTATMAGPPLGGAVIAMFGPVTTVVADAFSYLLSALGIRAIGGTEPRPGRTGAPRLRAGDLLEGWRHILAHPTLRPLLLNSIVVNGLIMVSGPLLAVLLLGHLGFTPWQYGLMFAAPCIGGLRTMGSAGPASEQALSRHLDNDQIQALPDRAAALGPAAHYLLEVEWPELYRRAEALRTAGVEPTAPRARKLVERMDELSCLFTGG